MVEAMGVLVVFAGFLGFIIGAWGKKGADNARDEYRAIAVKAADLLGQYKRRLIDSQGRTKRAEAFLAAASLGHQESCDCAACKYVVSISRHYQ